MHPCRLGAPGLRLRVAIHGRSPAPLRQPETPQKWSVRYVLQRLADSALVSNVGLHAGRREESVAHIMRLSAGHDLLHVVMVERLTPPVAA